MSATQKGLDVVRLRVHNIQRKLFLQCPSGTMIPRLDWNTFMDEPSVIFTSSLPYP